MHASDYCEAIEQKVANRSDVEVRILHVTHGAERFPFPRIASTHASAPGPILLIRAGIHGDEVSGPLSLLAFVDAVVSHAHARGVGLIVYPLGNPSGFEKGVRYNADNDSGDAGNNDFLRYELADGTFTDDIGASDGFKAWHWASGPRTDVRLPAETRLMHRLLRREPLARIRGVLDLHQDYITPGAPPAAYHYSFGDVSVYRPIVAAIERHVPIWRNTRIGAGFSVQIDPGGAVVASQSEDQSPTSDEDGFIVRHDGTLPDLMFRLGAPYCVTAETTGATPIDVACEVNMAWIMGMVNLLAERERD